ncbi:MAG: glycosyltransferase [Caldilineaceae bacterium]
MRFLFVSAQLPGHLDWGGYLETAAELQRLGHAVLWASGPAVAPLVAAQHVPFHPLQETGWRWPPPPPLQPTPDLAPEALQRLRAERALDQWLDENRVAQACIELIELGHRYHPDLLVSEMFVSAAGLAAEALSVPFVVAGWPAMQPKVAAGQEALSEFARERLQRLCNRFDLTGVNWTMSGPPALLSANLHLTYWSPTWYQGLDLLPQTRHVGGSAPPTVQHEAVGQDENPRVFITLGTSFGNDLNFFLAAAQATHELGCTPLLALGGQLNTEQRQTLRERLPSDTQIEERIDLDAVLPQVTASIHHGGAGVTHALVTHAVPQIIVPHAADQGHQAQGVLRSGIGLHLPAKEATVPRLVNALAQLLPDLSPYRAKAQALRAEFAALGGVPVAAQLLVEQVKQ